MKLFYCHLLFISRICDAKKVENAVLIVERESFAGMVKITI